MTGRPDVLNAMRKDLHTVVLQANGATSIIRKTYVINIWY